MYRRKRRQVILHERHPRGRAMDQVDFSRGRLPQLQRAPRIHRKRSLPKNCENHRARGAAAHVVRPTDLDHRRRALP